MKAFTAISGRPPLMPWRAYGVWWSRYWPYNHTGLTEVLDTYIKQELPLNMLVMDVDWHEDRFNKSYADKCGAPNYGQNQCHDGFGGFNWNKTLWPDPIGF